MNKLEQLEKRVEKLEFHKKLLQQLAMNYEKYSLYDVIISYDLDQQTYERLSAVTRDYLNRLDEGIPISLEQFELDFSIAARDLKLLSVEQFVKVWLKGTRRGNGMSERLAKHFW